MPDETQVERGKTEELKEELASQEAAAPTDLEASKVADAALALEEAAGEPARLDDTHSNPAAPAAPAPAAPAAAAHATSPPGPGGQVGAPHLPAAPIVEAAAHATQAAVSTVKQATQQVTAAVQQEAQRVTVAPRKAIYRSKRFLIGYGAMAAGFGVLAALAKRYKYFPADVGIARLIQSPRSGLYDKVMHAVSQLGWMWNSVATRGSTSALMWAAGFRMESAFT